MVDIIIQTSNYIGLENTTDVGMITTFEDYHKEIDCRGKVVQVTFTLRVMRNRKERIFEGQLIEVAIKGKDIKIK